MFTKRPLWLIPFDRVLFKHQILDLDQTLSLVRQKPIQEYQIGELFLDARIF